MGGRSWPCTDALFEYSSRMAVKMLSVPNVTMKGGSFSRVTRIPLRKPVAIPTTRPSSRLSTAGTWLVDAVWAMTRPASVAAAPTERSMPPVRMISVCAIPMVPTTATCCVISDRFAGLRNRGLMMPKTMIEITSTIAGLSAG